MRKFLSVILCLALLLSLSSCGAGSNIEAPTGGSGGDTAPAPKPADEEPLIHGIEIVEYPNPAAISEYEKLTDDQKIAFDALGIALKDILQNGPAAGKSYPLEKRVSWYDYKLAYNLYDANFTAANSIISSIWSADSLGTQDYVDSIYQYDSEGRLNEAYQNYLEVDSESDKILASIDHDGTEYGKALAIAKWMVDNITYPADYKERLEDYLDAAHTALMKKEAVCDGYAKAYDFLCKKAGLETIYVTGDTVAGWHAWNMIRIDEKWYHIDVTWMDDDNDTYNNFYKDFMMPDDICFSNGHLKATYYWDQENNIEVVPTADSYDLYFYYYESCEDMLEYYKHKAEISESVSYYAIIPSEAPETVLHYNGTEIVSDKDGQSYYIGISEWESVGYFIYFWKKR